MTARCAVAMAAVGLVAVAVVAVAGQTDPVLRGHVYDENGEPMAEATVCYVVPGGVDGLCSLTDERGLWELPRTRIETLRIQKKGYLRQTLSAVPRDEPVRMRRAASIHVRVVDDVTGEGIDGSSVNLLFPTGRRHGPFFPNDEGVIVHSLEPGSVRVMVSAEGYRTPTPAVAELPAAEKTEVVVRLRRADDAD